MLLVGKKYYVTLAALGMALAAGGLLLVPSGKEVALMELEDNYYSDARTLYTRMLESAKDKALPTDIVAPLMRLYAEHGDVDEAIALLERVAKEQPRSVSARRQLTLFYKQAQRTESYLASLAEICAITSSSKDLSELAAAYAFHGRLEEAAQTLEKLIYAPGYVPQEKDFVTVAYYHAHRGELAEAYRTLERLITLTEYRVTPETLALTLSLLLDAGNPEQAYRTAKTYLEKNKSSTATAMLLAAPFEVQHLPARALDVLLPYAGEIESNPQLFTTITYLYIALGRRDEAFAAMLERFNAGTLPPTAEDALFTQALLRKDMPLLLRVIKALHLHNLPEDTLLETAFYAASQPGSPLAAALRESLGAAFLRANPLLALIVEIGERGQAETVKKLKAVIPEMQLTPAQRGALAGIYMKYGFDTEAFALLRELPPMEALRQAGGASLALLYITMGKLEEGRTAFAALHQNAPPKAAADIQKGMALLAAAGGEQALPSAWLKEQGAQAPLAFLDDLHTVAYTHGNFAIAAQVAEAMYRRAPTPERKLQLAQSWLDAGTYEKALTLLKPELAKNKQAQEVYLAALGRIIKAQGTGAAGSYEKELETIATQLLRAAAAPPELRRAIAFALLDGGMRDRAANIFADLASADPAGPDTEQLLYMWGKSPKPEALAWLRQHYSRSPQPMREKLLGYFAYCGHPEIIVALLRTRKSLSDGELDLYLTALYDLKDKKTLAALIKREATTATTLPRLRRFAELAAAEDLEEVANLGYSRMLEYAPNDAKALKALAMQNFHKSDYSGAEAYLTRYLKHHTGDYWAHYAYGEILLRKKKKTEAREHFRRGLAAIAALPSKNLQDRMVEAYLHFRTEDVDNALRLYRGLISEQPKSKQLRADYAAILIEMERFDEAEKILSP